MPYFLEKGLEAQRFVDQDDFDASGDAASSGDYDLAADTVRSEAVLANTSSGAGSILVKPCSVGRCGFGADTGNGRRDIQNDFVHAGKKDRKSVV